MKKAKRFLTGLLSAALALSLCAMPAMADDGSGTTPAPTANPVWTQDTGSITIHNMSGTMILEGLQPARQKTQGVFLRMTKVKRLLRWQVQPLPFIRLRMQKI